MCDACVRCDVPYCIVKSKARLGKLVNQKVRSVTCWCLCLVLVLVAEVMGTFITACISGMHAPASDCLPLFTLPPPPSLPLPCRL